jgi:hypothetical protein
MGHLEDPASSLKSNGGGTRKGRFLLTALSRGVSFQTLPQSMLRRLNSSCTATKGLISLACQTVQSIKDRILTGMNIPGGHGNRAVSCDPGQGPSIAAGLAKAGQESVS